MNEDGTTQKSACILFFSVFVAQVLKMDVTGGARLSFAEIIATGNEGCETTDGGTTYDLNSTKEEVMTQKTTLTRHATGSSSAVNTIRPSPHDTNRSWANEAHEQHCNLSHAAGTGGSSSPEGVQVTDATSSGSNVGDDSHHLSGSAARKLDAHKGSFMSYAGEMVTNLFTGSSWDERKKRQVYPNTFLAWVSSAVSQRVFKFCLNVCSM